MPVSDEYLFAVSQRLKPESVFGTLCENMTSSTKPEVHNVQHCRSEKDRATATALCQWVMLG